MNYMYCFSESISCNPSKIYVGKSRLRNAGYGVFSKKNLKRGEIVEVVPFIELPKKVIYTGKNILQNYAFASHLHPDRVIVAFGYGSMYNHSNNPNVTYRVNSRDAKRLLTFVCMCDIPKGRELFINYGKGHQVNA